MVDEDEIILADLDDDELVQQMHDDLYDGMQDEIVEGVNILPVSYTHLTLPTKA